jgi:hypothetical protein
MHLVGQARNFSEPAQRLTTHFVEVLAPAFLRFVFGECRVACSAHGVALADVFGSVRFGTLPAAVGHRLTAPTVPQLASGSGERPALRAHIPSNRALLRSGGGRGPSNLGVHLVERIAKVVAQVVHASILCHVVSSLGTCVPCYLSRFIRYKSARRSRRARYLRASAPTRCVRRSSFLPIVRCKLAFESRRVEVDDGN